MSVCVLNPTTIIIVSYSLYSCKIILIFFSFHFFFNSSMHFCNSFWAYLSFSWRNLLCSLLSPFLSSCKCNSARGKFPQFLFDWKSFYFTFIFRRLFSLVMNSRVAGFLSPNIKDLILWSFSFYCFFGEVFCLSNFCSCEGYVFFDLTAFMSFLCP